MATASFTRKALPPQSSRDGRREARRTALARVNAIKTLLAELPLVMGRLHEAGMQATAQVMHEVVRKSGYEAAEVLEEMYKTIGNDEDFTDADQ